MATVEELLVKISADTSQLSAGMRNAEGEVRRSTDSMSSRYLALGAAIATASVAVKKIVSETANAADSQLRLEAVVRATGESAGITADEIGKFAERMEVLTRFDGEGIRDASSALLTFKTIQGPVFEAAIRSAMDISAVFKTDLSSSAIMVGKALENPTQGLLALRRAGISFTASQRQMIEQLEASGQHLKAQQLILAAIEGQVGGTAEALGNGLGGAVHKMSIAFGELFKNTGQTLEQYGILTSVINTVRDGVNSLTLAIIQHKKYWIELKAGIAGVAGALGLVDEQLKNDVIQKYADERGQALDEIAQQTQDFKDKTSNDNSPASLKTGKYTPISPGPTDEQLAEAKSKMKEMEKMLKDTRAETRADIGSYWSDEEQKRLERFRQKIEENKEAFDALGESGRAMKEEIEGNIGKLEQMSKGTGFLFERMSKYAEDNADRMADAFAQALIHMDGSFKSLRQTAVSVLNDIMAQIIKIVITRPLVNAAIGGLSMAFGGAPSTGASSAPATATGFAEGGRPDVGVPTWVGERGRELFIPDRSGTIIPNKALSGGSMSITQVFNISPGLEETVAAAVQRAAPIIEARAKQGVFSAIESGGPAARSVGRRN